MLSSLSPNHLNCSGFFHVSATHDGHVHSISWVVCRLLLLRNLLYLVHFIITVIIIFLTLGMQGQSPQLLELFVDPPEAERRMLPLISHRPILTREALAAQGEASGAGTNGLTCFSSFVAGSGSLHTSMQRTRALPFRSVVATLPSQVPTQTPLPPLAITCSHPPLPTPATFPRPHAQPPPPPLFFYPTPPCLPKRQC